MTQQHRNDSIEGSVRQYLEAKDGDVSDGTPDAQADERDTAPIPAGKVFEKPATFDDADTGEFDLSDFEDPEATKVGADELFLPGAK